MALEVKEMDKKTIEILEAPAYLKELLSVVSTGTEVILTTDNTPVARLLPIEAGTTPRIAGLHQGTSWISEDFDAPLPETFWAGTP